MKLIETDGKTPSRVLAAKNIRTELKAEFPGQKFSVKSRSFSMGNAVDVSWTDGPTRHQVESIIKKYEYGTFDAMTDCQGIKPTYENGKFGEAKYIHGQRTISKIVNDAMIAKFEKDFGRKYDEHNFNDYSQVGKMLSETSFYKNPKSVKKEETKKEVKRIPKNEYFILKYWYCLYKGWLHKAEYFSKRLAGMGINTRDLCKTLTDEQIEEQLQALNRA